MSGDEHKTQVNQDDVTPVEYARGAFRRIAEDEYHQDRQIRLTDYWNRPSAEDLVEDMVDHGYSEETATEAVKELWMEQISRCQGGEHAPDEWGVHTLDVVDDGDFDRLVSVVEGDMERLGNRVERPCKFRVRIEVEDLDQ